MTAAFTAGSVGLFSIPKPFTGHFGVIQENALRSWRALGFPVVVFGDETGAAEAAKRNGATHLPDVQRNEFGTPLLDDAFRKAAEVCETEWLCYLNADIALTDDFIGTLRTIRQSLGFGLVIGRRTNINLTEPIEFSPDAHWQRAFRDRVKREGVLFDQVNIDYFVFPRSMAIETLPPFAVGRPAWDNWMIYEARRRRIPVVDATHGITAVHQNHDYSHAGGYNQVWSGEEAKRNFELAKGNLFSGDDATHRINRFGRLVPNWRVPLIRRHLAVAIQLYPEWRKWLSPFLPLVKLFDYCDRQFRLMLFRHGIDLFPGRETRRKPGNQP